MLFIGFILVIQMSSNNWAVDRRLLCFFEINSVSDKLVFKVKSNSQVNVCHVLLQH